MVGFGFLPGVTRTKRCRRADNLFFRCHVLTRHSVLRLFLPAHRTNACGLFASPVLYPSQPSTPKLTRVRPIKPASSTKSPPFSHSSHSSQKNAYVFHLSLQRVYIPCLLTTHVFNPSLSLNKPHSPLQLPTPSPASIQQFQFQKMYKGYIASVPRPQRPHPRVAKQQVSAPPHPKPIKRKKQSRAEKCTHRPPNEPSAERGKRVAACEYVCVW